MRKRSLRHGFAPVVALLVALAVPAFAGQQAVLVFHAALTGGDIVGGEGSANGFANATLTVNGDQATLEVATLGLTNITSVTLFAGAAGTSGSVIKTFTDVNNGFVDGRFSRTVTLDPGVVNQIFANPQNFFLVVTTAGSPAGAVRGTIINANSTYLAGRVSGTSSLCNGGNGSPSGVGTFALTLTPDPGGVTYTLRYDLITTGLGNALAALEIGENLGGSGPITLGTNLTGLNGRFSGFSQIPTARAQAVQALPSGIRVTVRTPDSGAACAAAGAPQPAHEIFIPVAGALHGAANTNYMTDLNIHNNSGQDASGNADVLIQFFPAGQGSAAAQNAAWATLLPRGLANYVDVTEAAFNAQINGIGALRLVTAGNIFANARIYNNQTAAGAGTFGQSVPGLPRASALSEGSLVGLANNSGAVPAGTASSRTNVGFFNPSDNVATAAFELLDGNGTVIATHTLTLNPWQQLQLPLIGGLFTGVSSNVVMTTLHFLSGSDIYVYASIVDNGSGDGSYVTPGISSNGGTGPGV
jgi:CHRD domain